MDFFMLQWLKGLREKKDDAPRQPPGDLDHAINVAGLGHSLSEEEFTRRYLRRGTPILEVSWEGCMAEIREEGRAGTVETVRKQRLMGDREPTFGVDVKWPDGTTSWIPGTWLRSVGDRVEIWH